MKRKILIPVVVVIAVGAAVVYYRRVTRPHAMVLTGIVTTNPVTVSSQVQGQLAKVLVKEGDVVQANQLLALIEPQELRADEAFYVHSERGAAAQVGQAEAALRFQEAQTRDQIKQAEAALAAAQAQQAEAEATLELDKINLQRTEGLFREKIVSDQSLDQARTTYKAQEALVESLHKQVDAQRAAVALAQSNEDQIAVRRGQLVAARRQMAAAGAQVSKAEVVLNYTELRAPIPGVVSLRAALQGEVVNPAQPVITLINPDDLWVRADIPETYIDHVRLGDHFVVRLQSGAEMMGTVFLRGVDAEYATQRDVSRTKRDIKTFEIRLRVNNSDRRLWPGMTAYVIIPPGDVQ